MATAPAPRKRAEQIVFKIRVKDRTLEMTPNVSIGEKFVLRTATGLPFEAYWNAEDRPDRIGEDSVCVMWWLARRANGEPNLPWQQHLDEWPSDLGEDDLDFEVVDDDEENIDPEG